MQLFIASIALLAGLTSAEISYSYNEDVMVSAVAEVNTFDGTDNPSGEAAFEMSNNIAASGSKSLILMLSGQINILTQTLVQDSNKGGKTEAEAYAGTTAHIKYCTNCLSVPASTICATGDGQGIDDDDNTDDVVYEAYPKGGIVFSARTQSLSVDTNLDCEVEDIFGNELDCEVTGYVEVDLTLDTTAAHTFNFIADLSKTGTGSTNNPIRTVACFGLDATAYVGLDGGDVSEGIAKGYVGLEKTMFITQEASVSNLNQARNLRG